MSAAKFHPLLKKYQTALGHLVKQASPNTTQVMGVLEIRDQLQILLADKSNEVSAEKFRLLELDQQLKTQGDKITKAVDLGAWRASFLPSASAWWWFLDESVDKRRKQTEIVRSVVVGTIMVFIFALTVEIIKRFWVSSSDSISVVGTLLTLIFTASPFIKQGEEVSEWLLSGLPWVKSRNIADIRIVAATLALIALIGLRVWILPGPLATYYNNHGVQALGTGNLSLAQKMFQRAAALNPDRVVPYQNIADSYKKLGLEDQAIEWYQKAIERDSNFAPAYRGLGELYNQRAEYAQAEAVLLAGLSLKPGSLNESMEKITQYELLSNLGWSFWGQDKIDFARSTLEQALSLEAELKMIGDSQNTEYRLALPHFYLAQIYEQIGETDLAIQQWEECLRFLDQADWHQRERYFIAQEHLQSLTK